ncbi:hypothetical protein RM531_14780 [Salinisphaera sp. P385]|uniref:MxaK protein n=1 Tax=Spectribacter acetivorans TaxID=3075603 RepID=A0ABU3BCA5_9GAMM|nr:hypothetical protein [Salinisphaera sp. P385]MDT0619740.1 hypothetical protein [Salinisphaera sp. P385]
MRFRQQVILASVLIGLGVVGVSVAGLGWWQSARIDRLVADGNAEALAQSDAPAARFALAYRQRRNGAPREAAEIYRELIPTLQDQALIATHYNLANLYFLLAANAADETRLSEMVPLVLQARSHYQRVLYLQPGHYAAKYNLEYVERLMQTRDWIGSQSEVGSNIDRRDSGTGWVSVHELPDGLP